MKVRPERIDKIPINTTNLRYADSANPETWTSFSDAVEVYRQNTRRLTGMAICFHRPENMSNSMPSLVGIDLDHCFQNGKPDPKWQELITEITRLTFAEYSPSRQGLHAFVIAPPQDFMNHRCGEVEIYNDRRYFTVTGLPIPGCQPAPAEDADADYLLSIIKAAMQAEKGAQKKPSLPQATQAPQASPAASPTPSSSLALPDDSDIIQKARAAKNGNIFRALFDEGNVSDYKSESEADLALANIVAFWIGDDPDRIDLLMRQSALLQRPDRLKKWDEKHGRLTYGELTIQKAITDCPRFYDWTKAVKPQPSSATNPDDGKAHSCSREAGKKPRRPEFTYEPSQRSVDEDSRHLANMLGATQNIYHADGRLMQLKRICRPRPYAPPSENTLDSGAMETEYFDIDKLVAFANSNIDFFRFDPNIKDFVHSHCPRILANQILHCQEYWRNFRPLSGIVKSPILRYDGTILDVAGYDRTTCLFADFRTDEFPRIPASPTKEQAEQALAILIDALSEFAFAQDYDRSSALAFMLTAVSRKAVMAAPALAITSPSPGTGKTTLANLFSILATGRSTELYSTPRDDESFRKLLFSVLLTNPQVITFDNVFGNSLLNQMLCQALTEPTVFDRILGLSAKASASTNTLVLMTGNNLEISKDLVRRVIPLRLDPRLEDPSRRVFLRTDFHRWALAARPQLVTAALTILRAHCVAGYPAADGLAPFAGFEDWSKLIRGALAWLGLPDPMQAQDELHEIDTDSEATRNAFAAWHKVAKDRPITAAELLEIAKLPGADHTDLYEALTLALKGKEPNVRLIGRWCRSKMGQIADGLTLKKGNTSNSGLIEWQIVPAE